ncbi:AlkA N-terminal domain-containing protein [Cryobacterium sp. SO2]|uniref:DNA-3-methyladenine glycosylase 2 family protein n=1 Tax=Cryobacterium sp. SO2 TaxID=1897060 RepID=UPI0023DAF1E9|nr:AlkA N-terminal domain-containing protein [Cryobacterium sp. SO2]WEO78565.1 AlkA N-terminal domain-containing protein [Cryobacterium sp. SO2]
MTSPAAEDAPAGASARGAVDDPVFAERFRAMSSRDARFDGQFITGVHSTGIYCRPSCPAMTPKPGNVSFYLTAAAAHEAGLRACKRCLPDAVPGSPAWNIRDDLAARAMRLIGDGTVEREGVPGLARRLGYTPRHLTRVLVAEVGAGPLALARAHRAQTARVLLTGTDLSITDIAFAAGFGSVRQFNDTIGSVYERTPSALRAGTRAAGVRATPAGSDDAAPGSTIRLLLPARAPFDGQGLLDFLGVRAIPGVERRGPETYERTLRLPHGAAALQLSLAGSPAAPALACTARLSNLADLAPLVSRVRRLFDLDADAQAIDRALADDPALAGSVRRIPGIRVPGSLDAEETLFRALLGQQVSVAAARTALGRLSAALGEPVSSFGDAAAETSADAAGDDTGTPFLLFPTAARIAQDGHEVLRGPAARITTIIRVAEALATGDLVLDVGESRDELTARLTALPGIGPWTAGYVAMRVLGSPDILLTSDLALRQGADRLGLPAKAADLAARGSRWAPWRSYAGMHLWRAAGTARPAGPEVPSQNGSAPLR